MVPRAFSRREFIHAAVWIGGAGFAGSRGTPGPVRIGYIASPAHEKARLGAQLGAEEAGRAASLFRREFELVTANAGNVPEAERAAREMIETSGVFGVVGGFDEATCLALSALAARHKVIFCNVGCPADVLRGERCWRNTFHVEASAAMRQSALAQASTPGLVPMLWHAELERFGATQLNERFRDRFARPMASAAWASWMAIKILWEATLRGRSSEAAEVVRFLEGPRAHFDGHKGIPLKFRPADHQLIQPLYLVSADGSRVVAEVPPDKIRAPQTTSACRPGVGE